MQDLPRLRWTGLVGSSLAWALAEVMSHPRRPVVVVCPTEADASRITADLNFFLKLESPADRLTVLNYPVRPTDLDPNLVAEPHIAWSRLAVLHNLLEHPERTAVVCSFAALIQCTLPKERLLAHTDFVEAGSETDRDGLAQKLADAGYEREQLVEEPGQFAVRGGVVDFFPPHLPLPVRLELSGDEVESIRSFDPLTQRSLENLREASWIPCREILLESGARAVLKTRLKELADARDLP
ncbi:MAG: transcription-repair coupling factor, partial [Pseudomonadota bacterium]